MLAEACDMLWALSSLRVAVETGMIGSLASGPRTTDALAKVSRLDATMTTRIADVLVAYGIFVRDGEAYALSEMGRAQAARGESLRADIAVTFGQTRALVEEARRGTLSAGWRPFDPEVVRSQAQLSYQMSFAMVPMMKKGWPEVHAILEREGAVFVDIGVGGAGGACAIAKQFPKLRVIGIDPLPAALVEARANVIAHGLTDRIELRAQSGDELTEENSIDVAFLPSKFFGDEALTATLRALSRSLKPHGAIMAAAWRDVGEPHAAAVSKLRTECWGAGPRTTEQVTAMLNDAGFKKIALGPSTGSIVPILAQR